MPFEFDPNSVSSEPAPEAEPVAQKRSSGAGAWVIAILLLLAVGGGAWWYLNRPLPPQAPMATAPVAAPTAADDLDSTPAPDPQVADQTVRDWLARLIDQADPRWTSGGDLSRRIAGVIAAFADGSDPRSFLLPLAPTAPFAVETKGGQTVIAEKGYARFDWATKQLSTLHVDKVADAWKAIRPLVAFAWREIAPKGSQLDAAVDRALGNVIATPVPDGPIAVVAHGAVYQFADPKLESLSLGQKMLIRMGPANEKIVQAQAQKIRQALAASPAATAAPSTAANAAPAAAPNTAGSPAPTAAPNTAAH